MFEYGTSKKALHGERASFGEIVGQADLKEALLAVGANDSLDGLLIRGEKGTGKSTAVRALAGMLPTQRAVEGCPYGCPPDDPASQCPDCRERADVSVIERPTPLVTLPLGATRERVVGTLSVADALGGEYEFDPGVLARANRGILYVDEINLLDDHLVDVLLDAAASGINRVERDGVSVSHPAAFTLVGTMNPEEGDLRPQLRDRFALQVTVTGCTEIDRRVEIVHRALGDGDAGQPDAESEESRRRLRRGRERLDEVALPEEFAERIARICRDAGVDGHRADIAAARGARTLAALDDRAKVTEPDVRRAVELALGHRLQSRPFEDAPDAGDVVDDHFGDDGEGDPSADDAAGESQEDDGTDERDASGEGDTGEKTGEGAGDKNAGDRGEDGDEGEDKTGDERTPLVPGQSAGSVDTSAGDGRAPDLSVLEAGESAESGSRARAEPSPEADGPRVRTQSADAAGGIDAAASVRAAASRGATNVQSRDLRQSVRRGDTSALVLFAVDASASMRPAMRAAKGVVLELLKDTYQHRDEVAFVAFAGEGADVLLPPTDSVERAARHLKELPTGDRTPLPAGIRAACRVLDDADPAAGVVVLVTDGRANVADGNPVEDTREAARRLAESGARTVVVDASDGTGRGVVETITGETGGERLALSALSAEGVDAAVGAAREI